MKTMYQIAKNMQMPYTTVFNWMKGKTSPTLKNLLLLSKELDMSLDDTVQLLLDRQGVDNSLVETTIKEV